MKKLIIISVIALVALCLCACGSEEPPVVLDFSEPTAFAQEVDITGLRMHHGDLQSVTQNGDKVIIKAKITSNLTNEMTVKQNYLAVADLIRLNGFNTAGEIEYWAVADMTDGSESKVVQFTLDKITIDGIYNETILSTDVGDYATDVWIHPSLQS